MIRTLWNEGWTLRRRFSSMMDNLFGGADQAERVTLPHDAMLAMPRSKDAAGGPEMAYFSGQNIEYVKKFHVPFSERDDVHELYFDGVYMNASVVVNGVFAGKHMNGYTPFHLRIDEYLRFGAENEVKVMIRGSALPNSRWYPGEGIYRDVWMLRSGPVRIAPDGLNVTTVSCGEALGVVSAECEIRNDSARAAEGWAEVVIRGEDGSEAARRTAKFYVSGGETVLVRQRVDLDAPRLWSVESPSLYTCECRLLIEGETADEAKATFGVRSIMLDSRRGLAINGRTVKLKGGCVHHDNGVLGAVTLPDAEERRVRLLKTGGYNAIRTSHNPPSPALLDACDKLGMLVMHEFTDVWVDPKVAYDYADAFPMTWEKDVEDVVRRDRRHPSVIMWSIGNEIPETGNLIAAKWGRKLVDKFRALDPTRPVTNGINVMCACFSHMEELTKELHETGVSGGLNDVLGDSAGMMRRLSAMPMTERITEESVDMLDLVGYNYTADRYEREHEKHPYRIFYGSETFAADLDVNWALVEKYPFVVGDFCWTAWDYLGEAGCGRIDLHYDGGFMGGYPWLLASDGDFDLTGHRRPLSYWRETIWHGRSGRPYIAVHRPQNYGKEKYISAWNFTDSVESWTWPGYEGKPTAVEVYSDAYEAELYLNGKSLGRRRLGETFKKCYACWETAYERGTLTVVAYDERGQETGRAELSTAGEPALCLKTDRESLPCGERALCYVDIELRDEAGRLYCFSDDEIEIAVSGAARLMGSGSANPCTEESYLSAKHRLFEGRAQAVVIAGAEPGAAQIAVTWKGKTETVNLTVE